MEPGSFQVFKQPLCGSPMWSCLSGSPQSWFLCTSPSPCSLNTLIPPRETDTKERGGVGDDSVPPET